MSMRKFVQAVVDVLNKINVNASKVIAESDVKKSQSVMVSRSMILIMCVQEMVVALQKIIVNVSLDILERRADIK